MSLLSHPVLERLESLDELISCAGTMYRWSYDPEGELLETNCPDTVLSKAFKSTGCLDAVLRHAEEHREPIVISVSYGLSWCAVLEFGDELERIHVLGPIATAELSPEMISHAIQSAVIPARWRPKLIQVLKRVPVYTIIDFFRYTLMLHFCVTGQKLTIADIVFFEPAISREGRLVTPRKNRMKTYMTEAALMRMVTEGDINYKTVLQDAASASRGVRAGKEGSLEQAKVSTIVFISLCTRAAIQGGITPEAAYSRGDAYIQNVLDSRSLADTAGIAHAMYDDFIHMVHKSRSNPDLSPQIQSCCDYIELHADEKLSLSEIASKVGYADYYLSRKFKAETGFSINDYIKYVKIEKAKTMLMASEMSIQDICDRLQFGSRSFFAETFKEIAGMPPAAYREKYQKY